MDQMDSSLFSPFGAPFVQFLLFYNPLMTGHRLLSAPSLLILCLSAVPLYYVSIYSFVRVLHFLCLFFVLAFFYFYLLFLIPLHVSFGDFQNVTLTYQKIPAGFHFLTATWETLHAEFMSLENFYLNRQDVEGLNVEKLQVITNFDLIVSDIV